MIYSMTAFAREEILATWGEASWEIRSVNHRYLEMAIRVPEAFSSLETTIREHLKQKIRRGKVDVTLRYQTNMSQAFTLNQALVKQLQTAARAIGELINNNAALTPQDMLRWPGVLQTPELDITSIKAELLQGLERALTTLLADRQREGAKLGEILLQQGAAMQRSVTQVKRLQPTILADQRAKLQARFQDANVTTDPQRLEQELVLFAQKIDVAEEIDRLQTHLEEINKVVTQGGNCGRRLDFLLQEVNREANTLASKSTNSDITLAAVELKVFIEQMREQVQNIE